MIKSLGANGADSKSESPIDGNGWVFLQDMQYTPDAPLLVTAGQKLKVPNNTAGLLTLRTYAPQSAMNWYDAATSTFRCDAVGDYFLYRFNLTVEPSVNNRNLTIDFSIGTANSPYEVTHYLTRGAGIPTKIVETMPIPASSGFFNNGGTINLLSECDLEVYKISIVIAKLFKGPVV